MGGKNRNTVPRILEAPDSNIQPAKTPWVDSACARYPQYGWDFPEEMTEKFRKDP